MAEARALAVFQAHSPNGDTPVDVISELASLVREVTRFRDFLRDRVSELSGDQWSYEHPARERITVEIGLYERACDRSARLLADVARLGLEDLERRAADHQALLERARAERIVAGIDEVLAVLDLDERQWELAPRAMAALLLHLAGSDADAGPA
ncbi:MAG TPA: hypothetical protein VGQ26_07190 [Streptosporangiaceae bacterium]|nr:hypothetical protein [Streptosporangiaceae bacterium]